LAYQKKTGIIYKQIKYDPNNGFSFLHNDKWGYMNHKLEIILEPLYDNEIELITTLLSTTDTQKQLSA